MKLLKKLNNRSAVIGIVGLGYVGLPLVLRYLEEGYRVIGFDIDERKVEQLKSGVSYINYISNEKISTATSSDFDVTSDFSRATEADALIICVPTPLDDFKQPDLSYVVNTIETLLPHMRSGQVISLESTTYPGTTEEELQSRIETKGYEVGQDVYLVYSPEREDPGNPNFTTRTIPKVVGGITSACLEVGIALYENIIDRVVPVSSTRAAEMTKLLENIHRAINIGLVNEMKIVADKMGIDLNEVIDAAATKPFGFVAYRPGPGLGGHCIPIDPFYLTWKAREYGVNTRFIELAGEINSSMPKWVVGKIAEGLNKNKKPINGSKILILGIAYKKNVNDMRESPAVEIMSILEKLGAILEYSDPYIPIYPQIRKQRFDLHSVELTKETIANYDCIVLVTDHDGFDLDLIGNHGRLIVDTRGAMKSAINVIKA